MSYKLIPRKQNPTARAERMVKAAIAGTYYAVAPHPTAEECKQRQRYGYKIVMESEAKHG